MHLTMEDRAAIGGRPEPGRAWVWATWRRPPGVDAYGRPHPSQRAFRYLYTYRSGTRNVGGYGYSLADAHRRARFHCGTDSDGTTADPEPGSFDSRPALLALLADALDRGPTIDPADVRLRLRDGSAPPPGPGPVRVEFRDPFETP